MFDYKQIAEGARAFSEAGITLRTKLENGYVGVDFIPVFVNTAVACELYMKAMIIHNDSNTTEEKLKKLSHNLYLLFNEIPLQIQDRIKTKISDSKVKQSENSIRDSFQNIIKDQTMSVKVKDIANNRINKVAESFDEILKSHSGIFVDWRYHFGAIGSKIISCNDWFLYTFCTELHNEMVAIMKNEPR